MAEKLGFAGVWATDSMGRGRHTLDPFVTLSALHAGTSRIELGIGVLQVPLRRPGELAHRIQSLNVLLAGRLRLGVGAGSTRADFEVAGADYDKRFTTFKESLEVMRALWRGERVNGASLLAWPGTEGGPPVFLGAWRSAKTIERAARDGAYGRIHAGGIATTRKDRDVLHKCEIMTLRPCSPRHGDGDDGRGEAAQPRVEYVRRQRFLRDCDEPIVRLLSLPLLGNRFLR
jgi:alkanesulfonate monooxygenase SsuD/methylene tetrahydromethanopterin reductase-like flavin-dependent oxidoreductase (luciferase family)